MRSILITICLIFGMVSVLAQSKHSSRKLSVKAFYGPEQLKLANEKYVSSSGDTVIIDVWRFYISGVKLHYEDGTVYEEKNSYHLYDLEDSERWEFELKNAPEGAVKIVEFKIGVDSLMSVSGAMGGDLDPVNGMYWAWNSGYINAKLEGRSTSCKTLHNAFEFHIGGFMPPFQTLRSVVIELKNGIAGDVLIKADASKWLDGIELKTINSIVIPGEQAVWMAEKYSKMFTIIE